MPTTLRKHLILDLDRVGAGALQEPYGAGRIHNIAEARIGIDHQRAREYIPDRPDMLGKLAQRDQTVVRNAEERIGNAGAGHIGGRKPEIGDDARRQRVAHTRQHDGSARAKQRAKFAADGTGWHRVLCAGL